LRGGYSQFRRESRRHRQILIWCEKKVRGAGHRRISSPSTGRGRRLAGPKSRQADNNGGYRLLETIREERKGTGRRPSQELFIDGSGEGLSQRHLSKELFELAEKKKRLDSKSQERRGGRPPEGKNGHRAGELKKTDVGRMTNSRERKDLPNERDQRNNVLGGREKVSRWREGETTRGVHRKRLSRARARRSAEASGWKEKKKKSLS